MKNLKIRSTYTEIGSKIKKISFDKVQIYNAHESNWHFCHHPEIVWFKDKIYAMWSNSKSGEDEIGQRILYSSSKNFTNWEDPKVIVDHIDGQHLQTVLTAAGWLDRTDSLVGFFSSYEYETTDFKTDRQGFVREGDRIINTKLFCTTSEDGVIFEKPINLNVPICPNFGPQKTNTGSLLIAGNWAHAKTKDPNGIHSWKLSGIVSDFSVLKKPVSDDPDYFWYVSKLLKMPGGICEGSFFETEDNVIHMIHRSHTDFLYDSISIDDGNTWSTPEATLFTDAKSKFHFGRLPDGGAYYVGNPVPKSPRAPLVLSISSDCEVFDRHFVLEDSPVYPKYPGYAKGGMYAYPHTMLRDGILYVIYSVCKEDIYVQQIPLGNLEA